MTMRPRSEQITSGRALTSSGNSLGARRTYVYRVLRVIVACAVALLWIAAVNNVGAQMAGSAASTAAATWPLDHPDGFRRALEERTDQEKP